MTDPELFEPAPRRTRTPPQTDVPSGWLAWWRSRGGATQGLVPGLYAWAVTVAPVGYSRVAPLVAEVVASLGLVSLVVGLLVERRAPDAARLVVGWGLVLSAVVTWVVAPSTSLASFDAVRGVAGMFGWALFAFVIASPARPVSDVHTPVVPLVPRTPPRLPYTAILLLSVALSVAVELPGWRAPSRERALLVRLVALAAGLGLLTAASAIVGGRSRARDEDDAKPPRRLPYESVAWIAAACLLFGTGVTYEIWHGP